MVARKTKSTGGRVKKAIGGKWDKSRGHPGGLQAPPSRPGGIGRRDPKRRDPAALLAAKRKRAAQRSLRKSPPPKRLGATGPGYKKGGRATKAKGGKAKR